MSNDIIISTQDKILNSGLGFNKPCYLVVLIDSFAKSKSYKYFITIEKPEFLSGFIQAKGVFVELNEDYIIDNYSTILTDSKKELILEMLFPWHRIYSIRSLIFRAK